MPQDQRHLRGQMPPAHLERCHATWRMQWVARGAPGSLGVPTEERPQTVGGVCGPRPRSSPSKGGTEGDTRLVAVISTRIGCGVSDATTRVGSRRRGEGGPSMFCTVDPLPSVAGEQRGPGCRCPDGRRTGFAVLTRLRRANAIDQSGRTSAGHVVLHRRRWPTTDWTSSGKLCNGMFWFVSK